MATTAQDRIARVLLDYQIVSGAESRVTNSINRTRGSLNQLAAAAKAVDVPFGGVTRASQTLGQRLRGSVVPASDEAAASFRRMRDEAIRAQEAVNNVAGGAAGGGLRNRLRGLSLETVGREIVGLPSVQLGPVSSNDLGQAARGLGAAGITFTQIAAAMAPVVAVAAPLVAGYVALNASLAENKRVVDAATAANQRYYELIAGGAGTGQIEEAIEAASRTLEAAKNELASIEQAYAAGFGSAQAQEANDFFARLAFGLVQLSNADDALAARAEELRQTIFNTEADINRLTGSLDTTEVAANDAANALQEAARGFNEVNRAITIDLDALASGLAQAELSTRIDAMTDAVARHATETERLTSIQDDITDATAQSAAKLTQIAADLRSKESELERTLGIDLSEAERSAGLERAEAVEKAGEELAKLETDTQEELARIRKKYGKDELFARGERDAYAAFQAKQAREDELQDAEQAASKRQGEIEKALRDEQRTIDRGLAEQQRTIRNRYNEQLRTAQLAAQEAVRIENARAAAQLATLNNAYNAQAAIVANWAAKMVSYTNAIAAAAAGIKTGTPPGSANKSTANTSISPTQLGYLPRYASGGITPVNRAFMVGENGPEIMQLPYPTRVFSNAQSKGMGGMSIPITVNGNNLSRREVVHLAAQELNSTLKAAGWS